MKYTPNKTFPQVFFTHFVPCMFLGVALMYVVEGLTPQEVVLRSTSTPIPLTEYIIALANGLIVALLAVAFHWNNNRRHKVPSPHRIVSKKTIFYAAIVGFISGAYEVLLELHDLGIIILTLLVLVILVWHLRIFAHDIITMLRPGNIATWGDVRELLRIYLNMLAGFTLINATVEGVHILMGSPPPFGFIQDGRIFLNSLYYTVVTMTTLGYGDIVPKTWDTKLLLIFQCLVSYIMFALMIGITTRGVVSSREKETTLIDE
ncbi:MAG: potassium channel family protein [Pseudodesulfovibrio sp.]